MWSEGAHFGRAISNMLDQCIGAGIHGRDGKLLSEAIIDAGPGDYVEIGTAFGASAILVALTKRVWQIPGEIWCIDSFSEELAPRGTSPETVLRNAEIFGVRDMINIKVANSHPWPLGDRMFDVGLVDGSHRGDAPAQDFINMSKRINKYIILDDVSFIKQPNIARLASDIHKSVEWQTIKVGDKVVVFERVR
jgi:hypothetical protein